MRKEDVSIHMVDVVEYRELGPITEDEVKEKYSWVSDLIEKAIDNGASDITLKLDKTGTFGVPKEDNPNNDLIAVYVVFDDCQIDFVSNNGSYGGKEGLFEMALYDKDGTEMINPPDTEFEYDDVLGYLSAEEVGEMLDKYTNFDSDTNTFYEKDFSIDRNDYTVDEVDMDTESNESDMLDMSYDEYDSWDSVD